MGKVFSWEDIAGKRVPELSSFDDLADIMKAEIIGNKDIHGGLLFGSVLWGCHNRRSDLDFLVVYDQESRYDVCASST
ncbi:MAG: nucleotidyltransferase domain-containing protein [Candidatus Buchananbacteria bacterium]